MIEIVDLYHSKDKDENGEFIFKKQYENIRLQISFDKNKKGEKTCYGIMMYNREKYDIPKGEGLWNPLIYKMVFQEKNREDMFVCVGNADVACDQKLCNGEVLRSGRQFISSNSDNINKELSEDIHFNSSS